MIRAMLIWVVGLLTVVPWGTYYLLFEAPREHYALLIALVLFWIFGYWGVVVPLLAALKAHAVLRMLEQAQRQGQLAQALQSPEAQEVAIDFIAAENRIPRFVAARLFRFTVDRLANRGRPASPPPVRRGDA